MTNRTPGSSSQLGQICTFQNLMSFCKSFAGLSLNGKGSLTSVGFQNSGSRVTGLTIEAAQKKGGGSTKNGRDSNAQRRGVKVFGGQPVKAGGIIIRQTGTTVHPGDNVAAGKDHTLYALQAGIVVFKKNKYKKQVSVVDVADYEIPEGCKQKESDSRRTRRREQYANARRSKPASSTPTVAAAVVVAP